jgi:DNA-binding CsgD family transcriptional regulator
MTRVGAQRPRVTFVGASSSVQLPALRRSLANEGIAIAHTRANVLVRFGALANPSDVAALKGVIRPGRPVVAVVPSVTPGILRSSIHAGLLGCVLEAGADQSLAPAIRSVLCGQVVVPRGFFDEPRPALSSREKQILGLVVMGLTNAQIATRLCLAESTVKSHLSSSFAKLGMRNRRQAATVILDPTNRLGLGILRITTGGASSDALARR